MTNNELRYWVYLGKHPEAGPFPSYDEANREREHLLKGLLIGLSQSIYKIRTNEFNSDGVGIDAHD